MADSSPTEICRDDLSVPSGCIRRTKRGFLTTTTSTTRAVTKRKFTGSPEAHLRFRFRGPTANTNYFGTRDATWRQIGLKLLEVNPCNVIYVMWRIQRPEDLAPKPESIEVLVKLNPGMMTSAECRHHGYKTLASWTPTVTATDTKTHLLRSRLCLRDSKAIIEVTIDDEEPLSVDFIETSILETPATTGLRTDNGRFIFKYFVRESS